MWFKEVFESHPRISFIYDPVVVQGGFKTYPCIYTSSMCLIMCLIIERRLDSCCCCGEVRAGGGGFGWWYVSNICVERLFLFSIYDCNCLVYMTVYLLRMFVGIVKV